MAKPSDVVQVLKWESAAKGGDAADEFSTPAEIEPEEDAIAAAGLYGAESGKDGTDKVCALYREGDKWYFEDSENAGAGRKKLSELAASSSGITPTTHRALDQLVHDIAESSYEEVVYTGNKVTGIITYTDATKTTKIREVTVTYSGNQVTNIQTKQYDAAGDPITGETLDEVPTYSGGKITAITRTLS